MKVKAWIRKKELACLADDELLTEQICGLKIDKAGHSEWKEHYIPGMDVRVFITI